MLKVVCLVDKEGTALDRLGKGVFKYHDNLDYRVVAVHPKRPDQDQLRRFQEAAFDADIIDAQYYRTLYKLRDIFPWLKDKKTILTHNNPYAIEEQGWNDVDLNVGNNSYISNRLRVLSSKPVEQIPLTVDTDFWEFQREWPFNVKVSSNSHYEWNNPDVKPAVIMVANRIEGKKGILPVAIACAELGVKFILVGAISDPAYFYSVQQTGNVEFHEQITDKKLRELYYKSTIHVCNSVDNFESGTLPILEAMLCGVPVLTRSVGHVPDIYNGDNMVLHEGNPDDVEALQNLISSMLADKKRLQELRDNAWNSVKNRTNELRAYAYQKAYRQVLYPDTLPVSVIVPVYDNPEIIRACLDAIANQTYKNIELVVVDDNAPVNIILVQDFAKYVNIPVRYIDNTDKGQVIDYGLARARNKGAIDATGEVLVFCDQRQIMEPNAVEVFVQSMQPNTWLYGNKGAKKEFVENFSCIDRQTFINFGMFCERMDAYGGLSQETRERARAQNIVTKYVESAKAIPKGKSHNRGSKKKDIIRMKARLIKMGLYG